MNSYGSASIASVLSKLVSWGIGAKVPSPPQRLRYAAYAPVAASRSRAALEKAPERLRLLPRRRKLLPMFHEPAPLLVGHAVQLRHDLIQRAALVELREHPHSSRRAVLRPFRGAVPFPP